MKVAGEHFRHKNSKSKVFVYLSLSLENWVKQLSIPFLKGCPSMGEPQCNPLMPGGFGGGAGSPENAGCIFSRGALTATTLMGGGAGVGGARPELGCAWASPRLHGSHHPDYWGQGWGLTGWSRGPEVIRLLPGRTEVSCELGAVLLFSSRCPL